MRELRISKLGTFISLSLSTGVGRWGIQAARRFWGKHRIRAWRCKFGGERVANCLHYSAQHFRR